MSFFEDLKRRNVIRVALLYVIASWLLLQIADVLFPNLGAPEWAFGLVFGANAAGLTISSQLNPLLIRKFGVLNVLTGAMLVGLLAAAALVVGPSHLAHLVVHAVDRVVGVARRQVPCRAFGG